MLFDDYARDLEGISLAHLGGILDEARRAKPWFPKVADLLALWEKRKFGDAEKLRRARVLLGKDKPKAWECDTNLPPDAKSDSPACERVALRVVQPETAFESVRPSLES